MSLLLYIFLLLSSANATLPLDNNKILGVPVGAYHGTGTLKTSLILNPTFSSIRILEKDIITAKTTATILFGLTTTVEARLRIVPLDKQNFEVHDADSGEKRGSGVCREEECSFDADINDSLSLSETWTYDSSIHGFIISEGEQTVSGIRSTYNGTILKNIGN